MNKELKQIIGKDIYRIFGNERIPKSLLKRPIELKVLICYRKARFYFLNNKKLLHKYYSFKLDRIYRRTGCALHWLTDIGDGFYIAHNARFLINVNAKLGKNINIAPGVVIGGTNRGSKEGAPSIGNSVWFGANSVVVGKIKIGDNVLIAPNAYVNFDVPNNSIVIGNPGVIHHNDNATTGYINNLI